MSLALAAALGLAAAAAPPRGATRPGGAQERRAAARAEWRVEPGLEALAARLAEDPFAWRAFPGIGAAGEAVQGAEVWVVRDLRRHPALAPLALEPWVAGVAEPASGRIAIRAGEPLPPVRELARVLRHELAHLALHRATGGRHPRWLSEGYAQVAAGEFRGEEAWRLRLAFVRGGGASLRRLTLTPRDREADARLGYMLAYTAVGHLLERGGEPGLRALFARLRAGETLDAALRGVYGVTEAEFERAWRASVVSRYGWAYALSRAALFWLGVAALVVGVAARRARRDRVRLEALREAERGEGGERGEGRESGEGGEGGGRAEGGEDAEGGEGGVDAPEGRG